MGVEPIAFILEISLFEGVISLFHKIVPPHFLSNLAPKIISKYIAQTTITVKIEG